MPRRRKRSALFDNLKAILIFLVVFSHLLEPQTVEQATFFYLNIYAFHMPAFVFVSGWFSRKSTVGKTMLQVFLPYLIFQALYLAYAGQPIQFYCPYWIMWYLFGLTVWRLILAFVRPRPLLGLLLIPTSAVVALVCGFVDAIGYNFALSRVLVFLPFFLMGYFLSVHQALLMPIIRSNLSRWGSLLGVAGSVVYFFTARGTFQRQWLFHATSFQAAHSSFLLRLLVFAAAMVWIWFLLAWVTQRRIRVFSNLGRFTFFVYLFHGFVKLFVERHAETIYFLGPWGNILIALAIALAICALFGNIWLASAWRTFTHEILPREKLRRLRPRPAPPPRPAQTPPDRPHPRR